MNEVKEKAKVILEELDKHFENMYISHNEFEFLQKYIHLLEEVVDNSKRLNCALCKGLGFTYSGVDLCPKDCPRCKPYHDAVKRLDMLIHKPIILGDET